MIVLRRFGLAALSICLLSGFSALACQPPPSDNDGEEKVPNDEEEAPNANNDEEPPPNGDNDDTNQADPDICDDDGFLQHTVEASDWAGKRAGIAEYHYTADVFDGYALVDLIDESGESMGTMQVRQLYDDPSDPPGVMEASLQYEEESETPLRLITRGEDIDRSGYTVQMRLEHLDGDASLHMTARFQTVRCWQQEDPATGPGCAGDLPLDKAAYTLPSCGLIIDDRIQQSLPPQLDRLTYAVPDVEAGETPSLGGFRHQDEVLRAPTNRLYTLDVVDPQGVREAADVEQWLGETGVDAVVGTDAEQLLTTAFLDRSWWRKIDHHVAHCDVQKLPRPKVNGESLEASDDGDNGDLDNQQMSLCPGDQNDEDWGSESSDIIANVWGDPHLVTLDGYFYALQAAGEYVLVEAHSGEPLVVQGRFQPTASSGVAGCGDLTWNTAAATEIGGVRVSARAEPEWEVRIDGELVENSDDVPALEDGANLAISDQRVTLEWPGGEKVEFMARRGPGFGVTATRVEVQLPPHRRGQVRGLLGQFDGDSGTELVLPDGAVLSQPASFEDLYDVLAPAWQVEASDSLFDYADGEDTETFTIENFPEDATTVDMLPEELVDDAHQACVAEGIEDAQLLQACILDVVCFEDPGLAAVAAEAPTPRAAQPPGRHDLKVEGAVRFVETPDEVTAESEVVDCSPDADPGIAIFEERSSVQLQDNVDVDLFQPGTYTADGDMSSATIDAGTEATSYQLVRQIPQDPQDFYAGAVRFARPIVGVIVDDEILSDTDAALGAEQSSYDVDGLAGLHSEDDVLFIDDDGHRLDIVWRGEQAHRIRVLVEHTE